MSQCRLGLGVGGESPRISNVAIGHAHHGAPGGSRLAELRLGKSFRFRFHSSLMHFCGEWRPRQLQSVSDGVQHPPYAVGGNPNPESPLDSSAYARWLLCRFLHQLDSARPSSSIRLRGFNQLSCAVSLNLRIPLRKLAPGGGRACVTKSDRYGAAVLGPVRFAK
jgi:hypothetical protein